MAAYRCGSASNVTVSQQHDMCQQHQVNDSAETNCLLVPLQVYDASTDTWRALPGGEVKGKPLGGTMVSL